jgi:hypothetical protein
LHPANKASWGPRLRDIFLFLSLVKYQGQNEKDIQRLTLKDPLKENLSCHLDETEA